MQDIRKATVALFGVTLLWGGTFIWIAILDAAAHSAPGLDENDVAVFFVMMRLSLPVYCCLFLSQRHGRD